MDSQTVVKRGFPFALAVLTLAALTGGPAGAQNAAAGAAQFKMVCQTCHDIKPGPKNLMGPNLAGVFGRKAGTGDFAYSDAMKTSGLTWDAATLDKYLAAPGTIVPGGKMTISVNDAKQRANVIAYLQSLRK